MDMLLIQVPSFTIIKKQINFRVGFKQMKSEFNSVETEGEKQEHITVTYFQVSL